MCFLRRVSIRCACMSRRSPKIIEALEACTVWSSAMTRLVESCSLAAVMRWLLPSKMGWPRFLADNRQEGTRNGQVFHVLPLLWIQHQGNFPENVQNLRAATGLSTINSRTSWPGPGRPIVARTERSEHEARFDPLSHKLVTNAIIMPLVDERHVLQYYSNRHRMHNDDGSLQSHCLPEDRPPSPFCWVN